MKMSSSSSPCAACKFLRRKCTQECVFAPYFPADQPQKFAHVHKIFGASNVAKLLNDLNAAQREDAVNSLAYEAEARLRDPVYGCVGFISLLQQKLKRMQDDLIEAKKELANYIGPGAMLPFLEGPEYLQHQIICNNPPSSSVVPYNMPPMMGITAGPLQGSALVMRDPQQQQQQHQLFDAQQLAEAVAAREQQKIMRTYEQKPKQEFVRFNGGYETCSTVSTTPCGFSHMTGAAGQSPSLALGTFGNPFRPLQPEDNHQNQFETQLFLQSEQPALQPQQHLRSISEEGKSGGGPSC